MKMHGKKMQASDFIGYDTTDMSLPQASKPRDFLMKPERRKGSRGFIGTVWTQIKRRHTYLLSWKWWAVGLLLATSVQFLTGCGSDSTDPIYTVDGEVLADAESWCWSQGGVDYFLMEDNEPDLLVCKDGHTSVDVWWTL